MAAVTSKRPAPMGNCCRPTVAGSKKKRAHHNLGSIYNYKNLETLGGGTYGTVVKAQDQRTGETVAVKWVRPDDDGVTDVAAVFREAAFLEACRGHPSIVQVKEVVADEITGHLFIVTEFVGPTLESFLPRHFSDGEIRAIMRQLLRGAEKMHAAGMIHRDIKPDNVLVGPGGALKICDLGMAARTRPAGEPYPEETVAALWYRAPELMGASRNYGTAVDMWALGCVMMELLTGETLFEDAETEDDVLHCARDLEYCMEKGCMTDLASESKDTRERELSQARVEVLQGLLNLVPEKRLTAADALSHRWFEEEDAPLSPVLCPQKDQHGFISFL